MNDKIIEEILERIDAIEDKIKEMNKGMEDIRNTTQRISQVIDRDSIQREIGRLNKDRWNRMGKISER
jgi:methyl-accepting chemotaxis protein